MPKLNLPISVFLVLQQAVRNSAVQSLAGAVVPIDKLSMVVSIIYLYIIFKEKLSAKSNISIHIIIADTYLCFYGLNLKFTNLCNFA